jgi:hypothetical protein
MKDKQIKKHDEKKAMKETQWKKDVIDVLTLKISNYFCYYL